MAPIRNNPKRRYPEIHPSHVMGESFSDIRAPVSTPRFCNVRECTLCGAEEVESVAGYHFDSELRHICQESEIYKEMSGQTTILYEIKHICGKLVDTVPLSKRHISSLKKIHRRMTDLLKDHLDDYVHSRQEDESRDDPGNSINQPQVSV
jgi:hypothetical protein